MTTPTERANPYRIDGPAIVSVSGGRTSGFLICKIVEAHGGKLPEDVIPVFCNTGLEHAATYDFLRELGARVAPIKWLEYGRGEIEPGTESRKGEPFEALIRKREFLPNPVTRFCTVELKIRTNIRFARERGWSEWTNCVGLRADERRRVAKMKGDVKAENVAMPIADAGHTIADVLSFWEGMPFDLRLPNNDSAFGNCVGCFLKSRARLVRVERHEPGSLDWNIRMEALALTSKPSGARFRNDRPSYSALAEIARTQGVMFDGEEDALPCACTE